jgi:hypothetical protein
MSPFKACLKDDKVDEFRTLGAKLFQAIRVDGRKELENS